MPSCLPEDYDKYKHYIESDHFLEWMKSIGLPDDESVYGLIPYYDKYCISQKKKELSKDKVNKYVFITIQDFKRRICDLDKLQLFISKINHLYSEGYWVIEAGKASPPNVHIHMLVKINNSRKHKNLLNIEWMKLFETNLASYDFYMLKQHRDSAGMPNYSQWIDEKLDYFDNTKKNSHENSIDLGLNGIF